MKPLGQGGPLIDPDNPPEWASPELRQWVRGTVSPYRKAIGFQIGLVLLCVTGLVHWPEGFFDNFGPLAFLASWFVLFELLTFSRRWKRGWPPEGP